MIVRSNKAPPTRVCPIFPSCLRRFDRPNHARAWLAGSVSPVTLPGIDTKELPFAAVYSLPALDRPTLVSGYMTLEDFLSLVRRHEVPQEPLSATELEWQQ